MATHHLKLDYEEKPLITSRLAEESARVIGAFPALFDKRLLKGLERLTANSSSEFLSSRTDFHLKKILANQFFLQVKMEGVFPSESSKPFFLKLFRPSPSCLSIAFASAPSRGIQKEQILRTLRGLLPSVQEVAGSFYLWQHPEQDYLFSYFEVQKLRGKDPSAKELRNLEQILISQLLSISPLTPAVFWPYNKEDSFRQIQLLQREIKRVDDLPHVSVHFQEQTPTSLEFLFHLVRPSGKTPLDIALKSLPHAFIHFCRSNQIPFSIEIGAFSVKVPSFPFEMQESINLLYARRYAVKQLESVIGPFQDINGGLFEIQQQHFEAIRVHLSNQIPHFELFAEKVFYALHPVETWLSLSLCDAAGFFSAFSSLLDDPSPHATRIKKGSFCIIKNPQSRTFAESNEKVSHAHISLGDSQYLCFIGPESDRLGILSEKQPVEKTLRLVFQEGPPPSLNPQYSCADIRSRILNKLLFEGLTRLNERGEAELAGAKEYICSPDGLVYTFKLRTCYWSNGEKVTAADYVSSWQRALAESINHPEYLFVFKGASSYRENSGLKENLGFRALDAATLQIELEKPDAAFLHKLAQPFFFPLFGTMREPKWFNGPYMVRELHDEGLLLNKNAYYWDTDAIFFDQISLRWMNHSDLIFSLFERGSIDWIGDPLTFLCTRQIAQLQEEKKLRIRTVCRRFSLYFNTKHPVLSHPKVRRAMSLVLDRTHICSAIFIGATPASPLPPCEDQARLLFDEGLKELGISRENFPSLSFLYSRLTRREQLAAYLQKAWREALGIFVHLEGDEWNYVRSRIEERSFDICVTIQDTINEGSLDYYERHEGANSWNFSQWTHPEYRKVLQQAKQGLRSTGELDTILKSEAPFSPLFHHAHLYAHHPSLEGFWIDPEGCIDFSRSTLSECIQSEKNVERKIV